MAPRPPVPDVCDRLTTGTVLLREHSRRSGIRENGEHLLRGEFGEPVRFTTPVSSTLKRISGVLGTCSVPEMFRSDTPRCVTRMKHTHLRRAVVGLRNDSMHSSVVDLAVPTVVDGSGPDEAIPLRLAVQGDPIEVGHLRGLPPTNRCGKVQALMQPQHMAIAETSIHDRESAARSSTEHATKCNRQDGPFTGPGGDF